jgi:transcriptional regulator with XRE-family HTH domain
MIAGD